MFCRQTGTRDIQPRLEKLLEQHIPLCKPFILKGSVQADRREAVLNQQVQLGVNTLICNPKLVQTGLDLLDFPTIIFFEVDYSLYVMGQASRRAWRLIQDKPCKVYYPFYEGLMENQAVELIGLKQQAAGLLYGEETGGLSTLKSASGGSLLAELAAEMGADKTISDLSTLFASHAQQVDPTESAWFVADVPEDPAVAVEPVPAIRAITSKVPVSDPLLAFLADLGGVISEVQAAPNPARPAPLPPRKRLKRRRVRLLDVPSDETAPVVERQTTRPHPATAPQYRQPLLLPQDAT